MAAAGNDSEEYELDISGCTKIFNASGGAWGIKDGRESYRRLVQTGNLVYYGGAIVTARKSTGGKAPRNPAALINESIRKKRSVDDRDERPKKARLEATWRVARCASRSSSSRRTLESEAGKRNFVVTKGTSVSAPAKVEAERVVLVAGKSPGVCREVAGGIFGRMRLEEDYSHFRSCGYRSRSNIGSFAAGTADRAVSVSTVAAYDELRRMLPACNVTDGDLGENIILEGPDYPASTSGLYVGCRLSFHEQGERTDGPCTEIELTKANEPCYRLQYVPWAADAQTRWKGKVGNKWWTDPACLLSQPGGRGWLAKIVVAGNVTTGDICTVIPAAVKSEHISSSGSHIEIMHT